MIQWQVRPAWCLALWDHHGTNRETRMSQVITHAEVATKDMAPACQKVIKGSVTSARLMNDKTQNVCSDSPHGVVEMVNIF